MRALVLWADDASPNLGVRALGQGTAALLDQVWPGIEVSFQNFGRGPSPLPLRTPRDLLVERVTGRAGLARWLKEFDLVVDTRSGDSFADIYGVRRLSTMSLTAEVVHHSGTPLALGPQTIGPFTSVRGRALGRRTLRTADVVLARDPVSAAASADLGRPVDGLTTDVVFALPVPDVPRDRDVLLNVSGLLWHPGPHVDPAHYRSVVTAVYEDLRRAGRRVDLLAHVLPSSSPDDDVPALEEFHRTVAPEAEVLVPTSLDDVRRIVASAQLVIGSRMHACLNALSVGTPAVPLAYSRKFAPLLGELGWTRTVDLRDADAAAQVVRHVDDDALPTATAEVTRRAHDLLTVAHDALRGMVRG